MITVGIPTLNGPDRLRRCLESIFTCTSFDQVQVRVLVCDDGSDESCLKHNKDLIHMMRERGMPIDMIMNGRRCGIAKSWNALVRHYEDADVHVLSNDDIEVVPHWLDVLDYSVRSNGQAGMVALNALTSLTKAQHALLHPFAQDHVRTPVLDYHEANLLDGGGSLMWAPGYLFSFRRDAYNLVGGFDERYFCFYEEVDFGISLRVKNLFSFVASYPMVYHMGGATTSQPKNMNAAERLLESRQKFKEKWGKTSAQLRDELRGGPACPRPLREWNSQIHNHKD